MNSYQKLKAENQKLRRDIIILVKEPQSAKEHFEQLAVKMNWQMRLDVEKAVMFGDSSPK